MLVEKRQIKRSDAFLVVEFRPHGKTTEYSLGVTSNISHEGFSLDSQVFDFKPGETLEFRLKHPYSNLSVSATGRIIWKKDSWYNSLTGIKFIDMDEEAKTRITNLIHMEQNKPSALSLNKDTDISMTQEDKESSSTITIKEEPSPWMPPDNGQTDPEEIHAAPEKKKNINRLYITTVTIAVIILTATFYLILNDSKEEKKNDIPPSVSSVSPQQTDRGHSLADNDETKTDSLPAQELTESVQTQTVLVQGDKKESSEQPAVNPIKNKQLSSAINIQNRPSISQEIPKSETFPVSDSKGEIAKKTGKSDSTSLETTLNIPEKTEEEIKQSSDSKTITTTEIKEQSRPEAPSMLRNIPANQDVELQKIQIQNTQTPQNRSILFEESFNSNSNNWEIFNTNMASAQIKNGEYRIENKRKKGPHIIFARQTLPSDSDFVTEASIKTERNASNYSYGLVVKNSDNRSYGLVTGAKDTLNNYAFKIKEDGSYSITRSHNGTSQEIAGGNVRNSGLNQNAVNTLKIVRQGNNMKFYINDNFIHEISNLSFFGNKTGFIVEGESKIAVEKIRTETQ